MESREFKPFGSVSALTLGGGGIGNVWGETSKEESIASVHLALESGIDHLDVAPMYGKGEAERVVGEAIKERSRDSFRLTTKCALGSMPDEEVYDRFNTSLIRSLDTMGTDYVDLFLLHSQLIENDHESQKPDSSFVATGNLTTLKSFYDAVVPAMETLKKEGKILNWGIGPGQEEAVCDVINSTTPPDAIQCGVNVLNSLGAIGYASTKPNPKLVLDESKKKDIPILAIRAVQAGALTSKMDREPHPSGFDHPDFADYEKAQPFRELAEDWGESPASLAHRYALSIDKVGSVILGIKNREELIECLEAEKKGRLDTEQILTLENLFN